MIAETACTTKQKLLVTHDDYEIISYSIESEDTRHSLGKGTAILFKHTLIGHELKSYSSPNSLCAQIRDPIKKTGFITGCYHIDSSN